MQGYEKIAIFEQYLALFRKGYNIGPQLLLNVPGGLQNLGYNAAARLPDKYAIC